MPHINRNPVTKAGLFSRKDDKAPRRISATPTIAITMGDPAGVGPEIILRALAGKLSRAANYLIIGDSIILAETASKYRLSGLLQQDNIFIEDISFFSEKRGKQPHEEILSGRASFMYLEKAHEAFKKKIFDALVTAPVNKERINRSGVYFTGHTEYLTKWEKGACSAMIFISSVLNVLFITGHVPLKSVTSGIKKDIIIKKTLLFVSALKKLGFIHPRLAVCGLNPHAGEGGYLGKEEKQDILPAVIKLQKMGFDIQGPLSSDTVFYRAYNGEFDGIVSMYHDQGGIPVKLVSFDNAVNFTAGLSFPRTSPVHGTGFDASSRGQVKSGSMEKAIELAVRLSS